MNKVKEAFFVARSLSDRDDFVEYLTRDTGGWSTQVSRAYRFSEDGASCTLAELRNGSDAAGYRYNLCYAVVSA